MCQGGSPIRCPQAQRNCYDSHRPATKRLQRPGTASRPQDMSVLQDLRYALRMLARAPVYTAVVVATLALGIGANTAIYSLVVATVLRSAPYGDSERLVAVWTHWIGSPVLRAPLVRAPTCWIGAITPRSLRSTGTSSRAELTTWAAPIWSPSRSWAGGCPPRSCPCCASVPC